MRPARATSQRSRRLLALAVLGGVLAAVALPAATAAPPPNDGFATAQLITGDEGAVTGTNVEATFEPGEPDHDEASSGRSVWFRWTAASAGSVLFETCGGTSFDTLLAVYTGSAVSELAEVRSDDDTCGEASRVSFTAEAGTTYSIVVAGFEGASGTYTLHWRRVLPPANDMFGAATPLLGSSGGLETTTLGATLEPGELHHAGGDAGSIWFVWTPTMTATANVETCGSAFDTVLAVYTGESVASLDSVASNDDACRGGGSRVRFDARAGTAYRIAVAGVSTEGDVVLTWVVARPPANARASAARRLRGVRGAVAGSNVGAPYDPKADDGAPVWFRWRAPRSGPFTFDTCTGRTHDTSIRVFRSASGRRNALVDDNDDACSSLASRVAFLAERGVDYLIAVGGYRGGWGAFTLAWRPSRGSDGSCRVPDVRGLTLVRARVAITSRDCRLGRIVTRPSSIVPRGRIVAQFPNPNTRLPLFGRVNVEVSG